MKTPYQLLEVAVGATDEQIRQAYLQKVKAHPPERDQQQFRLLNDAYEAIKTKSARLSHELFTLPPSDFNELLEQAFSRAEAIKMTPEQVIEALQLGLSDEVIARAISYQERP